MADFVLPPKGGESGKLRGSDHHLAKTVLPLLPATIETLWMKPNPPALGKNFPLSLFFPVLLMTSFSVVASDSSVDMTDREQTDRLLEIKTLGEYDAFGLESLLDVLNASPGNGGDIKVHDGTGIPTYRRLWRKPDVIMIHPPSPEQPGVLDFSKITRLGNGRLSLLVNKHPAGNHQIKILKNGEEAEAKHIMTQDWEDIRVDFDKEDVVIEVHATAWAWEHSFITYRIEER